MAGQTEAEKAWANHFANFQANQNRQPGDVRPGDWTCPKCWPKVNVFGSKSACFQCGTPRSALTEPPPPEPKGISFGVRGDSLLQTRHEGGSKYAKKWRTFKADMENEFYSTFGNCTVDYDVQAGATIQQITLSIANGPQFDILCVGIACQDLLSSDGTWTVVSQYPVSLDEDLQLMAETIKSKSPGSLVMIGGPAEIWDRPARWDKFIARASNTIRRSGIQVVPTDAGASVLCQMTMASDGYHFENNDHDKELFAKAWANWLLVASADPTFGRTMSDENAIPDASGDTSTRHLAVNTPGRQGRSRSPQRPVQQQYTAPFVSATRKLQDRPGWERAAAGSSSNASAMSTQDLMRLSGLG